MTNFIDTYCPECDDEICAVIKTRPAAIPVRGEDVVFHECIAVCPDCGCVIGDARIESSNLERAFSLYRSSHGIIAPETIKKMREDFGLSLREFSKFLGFGEQTVYRYERGDLPDQAHNNTLLSAKTLSGARHLLSQNHSRLSEKSIAAIERRINAMAEGASVEANLCGTIESREADAPSAANGFRRLDSVRVFALVWVLANNCRELYWTKLQKAMFFADRLCYERRSSSLTGLTYAHAYFGPVMDHMDELRLLLVSHGVVKFQQQGWGEIVVPLSVDSQPFNDEEMELIQEVSEFVNSFNTATDLSDFSHKLSCWSDSIDGEIINYSYGDGEVGASINKRMASIQLA